MFKLIRLIVVLFLLIGGIGFVLYQVIRFLGMTRWSSSRRERERKEGQRQAAELLQNPVKWEREEWDLLSQYYTYSRRKGVFTRTTEGMMTTIYSEDFISFVIKQYHSNEWLLSVSTHNQQFSVVKRGKRAEVWKGDENMGSYERGIFYDLTGTVSGEVKSSGSYDIILLSGKDVAHLSPYKLESSVNDRAFELVREDQISPEQDTIFTILCVIRLLEKELLGE